MSESSRERVNAHREIAYTESFKQFIKEHPGYLARTKKLIEQAIKTRSNKVEEDDFVLERLERNPVPAFKLSTPAGDFFIKCENVYKGHGGFNEFKSNEVAQERIKDLPNVEVIEGQLGFSDKEHDYFVAPWRGGMKEAMYYLYTPDGNAISPEDKQVLDQTIKEIDLRLPEFTDNDAHNMFYDVKTKKIMLFDLHRMQDEQE